MRQENARLMAENNQLHMELLSLKENSSARDLHEQIRQLQADNQDL